MNMKVCSLSSGSKGNCTYIESEQAKILLDVGVGLKYLLEALKILSVEPTTLDGIVITHEHSDHIKGVEAICKKYDLPIFCPISLYNVLSNQMPTCANLLKPFKEEFYVNDLRIVPFRLSHDSVDCYGYRMIDDSGSVSFVTDTGYLPEGASNIIENSSLVFLESNYDPDMLFACSYPIFLKKRIMSNSGHLSNLDCAKIIAHLARTGTKRVVLSHISENSNTPYLAYNTVKSYLLKQGIEIDRDIKIGINEQHKINTIYKLIKKEN